MVSIQAERIKDLEDELKKEKEKTRQLSQLVSPDDVTVATTMVSPTPRTTSQRPAQEEIMIAAAKTKLKEKYIKTQAKIKRKDKRDAEKMKKDRISSLAIAGGGTLAPVVVQGNGTLASANKNQGSKKKRKKKVRLTVNLLLIVVFQSSDFFFCLCQRNRVTILVAAMVATVQLLLMIVVAVV